MLAILGAKSLVDRSKGDGRQVKSARNISRGLKLRRDLQAKKKAQKAEDAGAAKDIVSFCANK
jgi:hypothetical protein